MGSNDSDTTLQELKQVAAKFRDERDWMRFHKPKDLAMSVSIEANEMLELFQWKSEQEIEELLKQPEKLGEIKDELADVINYCMAFSDTLGIDLSEAVREKNRKNEAKYPVEKSRGTATKYTGLW